MAQKKTVEVIVGEKVEGDVDKSKAGKDATAPPAAEAGGRWHEEIVICPHCRSYRYIVVSDTHYEYYTCGNCGGTYKR